MKKQLVFLILAAFLGLSACGNNTNQGSNTNTESNHEEMDHGSHSSSGELPAGLKAAENNRKRTIS